MCRDGSRGESRDEFRDLTVEADLRRSGCPYDEGGGQGTKNCDCVCISRLICTRIRSSCISRYLQVYRVLSPRIVSYLLEFVSGIVS